MHSVLQLGHWLSHLHLRRASIELHILVPDPSLLLKHTLTWEVAGQILPLTLETEIEFLASSFDLGSAPVRTELSVLIFLSASQIINITK